jgi:hypothetical protein
LNNTDNQFEVAQNGADSEVSLKTLKPEELEKIMAAYKAGRDVANNYYKAIVEPKISKRMDIYKAPKSLYKKKFPGLSESSEWISRDVKTTIDWLIPSLIEVFTGSDDPVDILGVQIEDDGKAKKIQELVKYFVQRKNSYFVFMYTLIKEGLETNFGVAKIHWKRDEEREPMQIMADSNAMQMLMSAQEQGAIEITKVEPITEQGDLLKITFDVVNVKCNIPVLENLSPSELRFTQETKNIHEAKFVAHRKIVKGDYLKRKENEGVYENVDQAIEDDAGNATYSSLDTKHNEEINSIRGKLSDNDNASKDIELYEAYIKVDYNNDGVYENVIVHAVGDTALRVQDNTFEMPPFFIFSPEYDSYSVFGDSSFADTLEQLQDLKTALVRQIIIATAKNNVPQKFVNEAKVDIDAMIDGEEVVPAGDNPSQNVYIAPAIAVSPYTMDLVQYAQNEIENQSGSTRYNQGLDSNSLNKTATGINAIMGAADKKIRLIARLLAETTWIPIIKFLILLCQKFLDEGQIIRLTNENVTINKDELNIDYDLIVNVGQGAGTKEAQIQYLMLLIQQLYPRLEAAGIVDENSWYNISKELLEKMGIRSVEQYLVDPQSPQAQQKKAMAMQQQQVQQQQLAEQAKAQAQPKVSVNYRDLPIDAKAQALQANGLQTTPESVMQKEFIDKS